MKIKVLEILKKEHIPSGSGIIASANSYYVIGDDSPFLFSLNSDFEITSKTPLVEDFTFLENGRIPKSEKPDFEALERIDKHEMVVFGSGSKSPQRDVFIRILLKDPLLIENYDSSDFYTNLKNLPLFKDSELNIEAAAFYNNQIFLFNRNKNLILEFDYKELVTHLQGKTAFPQPKIREYSLPRIKGIEAGFSGATALKNESKIIFTASVEDTDNAYDDGEILGSFIGVIDISHNNSSESFVYCKIPNQGAHLKVESVSVEEEISSGKAKVVLITDDDKGNSIILKCMLNW
ncbi:DUF6929 family protein [Leeuwenhoekiella sp. LLG6367-2.1]|uniref:DUF6929 family protein n=1 Tax=Leeuwenhoekiella sp. LLG6367-2.1 TaxID=3160833 RepID=UPI00386BEBFA